MITWNSEDAGELFHRHQMLVFKEDRNIFSHPAKQRAQQRLATLFASFVKVTGLSLGGGFAMPEFCQSDGLESVLIGVMEELRRTALARPGGRTRREERGERPETRARFGASVFCASVFCAICDLVLLC